MSSDCSPNASEHSNRDRFGADLLNIPVTAASSTSSLAKPLDPTAPLQPGPRSPKPEGPSLPSIGASTGLPKGAQEYFVHKEACAG